MRLALLILLGLVVLCALGVAGWWGVHEYYAYERRQRARLLRASPRPPDTTFVINAPTPPEETSGVVEELPRGRGRIQGSTRRGRIRTGFSTSADVSGTMRWMTGRRSLSFDTDAGLMVTVRASVERGQFRVYLRDPDSYGYRWAEARPGEPLRLSGRLIGGLKSYFLYVESPGYGRVEGVRWVVQS